MQNGGLIISFFLILVFFENPLYLLLSFIFFICNMLIYLNFFNLVFTSLILGIIYFSLVLIIYLFIIMCLNLNIFEKIQYIKIYKLNFLEIIIIIFLFFKSLDFIIFSIIKNYFITYNFYSEFLYTKFNIFLNFFINDINIYIFYLFNYFGIGIIFFRYAFYLIFINIIFIFKFNNEENFTFKPKIIYGQCCPPFHIDENKLKNATSENIEEHVTLLSNYFETCVDQPMVFYFFIYFIALLIFFFIIYAFNIKKKNIKLNYSFIQNIICISLIYLFSFLINNFLIIIVCVLLISSFQILLLINENTSKIFHGLKLYVFGTAISSLFIIIGALLIVVYTSVDLKTMYFICFQLQTKPFILIIGSMCLFLGFIMKIGIFPFSLYSRPIYQYISFSLIFYFQIISKFIYITLFYKLSFFLFLINAPIFIYTSVVVISVSIIYGIFLTLKENNIKLFLFYSSSIHTRYCLLPFIRHDASINTKTLNVFAYVDGLFYLYIYRIIMLLVYFCFSFYKLFDCVIISDFCEKIGNKIKNKYYFRIIVFFLAGIPPSILFIPKYFLMCLVFKFFHNFYFLYFIITCSAITSFYYMHLLKIIFLNIRGFEKETINISQIFTKFNIILFLIVFICICVLIYYTIFFPYNYSLWASRFILRCIFIPEKISPVLIWI